MKRIAAIVVLLFLLSIQPVHGTVLVGTAPSTVRLRTARVGHVGPDGEAVVTGTVRCGTAGEVGIHVHVRQQVDELPLHADGYARLTCPDRGSIHWSITVFGVDRFAVGRAEAFADATLLDEAGTAIARAETPYGPLRLRP